MNPYFTHSFFSLHRRAARVRKRILFRAKQAGRTHREVMGASLKEAAEAFAAIGKAGITAAQFAENLNRFVSTPEFREFADWLHKMSISEDMLRERYEFRRDQWRDSPLDIRLIMYAVEYFRYVRGRIRLKMGRPWYG